MLIMGGGEWDAISSPEMIITVAVLAAVAVLVGMFVHRGVGRWIAMVSFLFSLAGVAFFFLVIAISGMGQPT